MVELMIITAIIGILVAIAIPAYQDNVVRSKVTEAVLAASACRTAVSERYQSLPPGAGRTRNDAVEISLELVQVAAVGAPGSCRQRPVLPNPPAARALVSNSSTTSNAACTTGTMTSCANRSNGCSTYECKPRFQQLTISCPW